MERRIVRLEIENLGTELWLVSNPEEVEEAFATPIGTFADDDSPLDLAARVSEDCVVLAAHWGNDIPRTRDMAWLADLLSSTHPDDHEEIEELCAAVWASTDEDDEE
jgi:hypothetical protein